MKEYLKNKVDLHLHFDGSLPYSVIPKLAEMSGVELDESKMKEIFTVPENCESLVDYLKCFDVPGQLLQTKETLSLAMETLLKELYAQNVLTVEVRFAPQLHKRNGLTGEEIVESVLEGQERALAQCEGMKAGTILCMMVNGETAENMETVELTKKYLGKGVVCLDIAGPEGMIPMMGFKVFFDMAKKLDVPYIIHAGECGSAENVNIALDLGAKRIGHGIAAIKDEAVLKRLVDTQTPIEVCPVSNIDTKAFPEGEVHPAKKLLDAGVCVTINTDNMTVSGTTLDREYEVLMTQCGFTEEDILKVQENGRKASFLK